MDIGAPALLASYAYQQAGGGREGVLAALGTLDAPSRTATTLIGGGPTGDTLELGATDLGAATYGLAAAGGQGSAALQELLNRTVSYDALFGQTPGALDARSAAAYAAYQYAQAQRTGQIPAFLKEALGPSGSVSQAYAADLLGSVPMVEAPAPAAKEAETPAGVDTHQTAATPTLLDSFAYDPMDTNQDGVVSAGETLAYGLDHAFLDPRDTNFDGFVSPMEAQVYAWRHPSLAATAEASGVDLWA